MVFYTLELQWVLLALFFIVSIAVFRGLLNYLILNLVISISFVLGIVTCNSLLCIISCYGKVGYYPFFLLLVMLYYNTSNLFILFDLINKWAYISVFELVLNECLFWRCSELWLVLLNLIIVVFFIRLITSIKHIVFISSYLLVMQVYLLLLLNHNLYSMVFLLVYSIVSSLLVVDLLVVS